MDLEEAAPDERASFDLSMGSERPSAFPEKGKRNLAILQDRVQTAEGDVASRFRHREKLLFGKGLPGRARNRRRRLQNRFDVRRVDVEAPVEPLEERRLPHEDHHFANLPAFVSGGLPARGPQAGVVRDVLRYVAFVSDDEGEHLVEGDAGLPAGKRELDDGRKRMDDGPGRIIVVEGRKRKRETSEDEIEILVRRDFRLRVGELFAKGRNDEPIVDIRGEHGAAEDAGVVPPDAVVVGLEPKSRSGDELGP